MGCLHTKSKQDAIAHISRDDYINRGELTDFTNFALPKVNAEDTKKYYEEKNKFCEIVEFPKLIDKDDPELRLLHELSSAEPEQYDYKFAKVISVYDGDTYTVEVAKQTSVFDGSWKPKTIGVSFNIRLYGADTPEVRGETKEKGIQVRDYVRGLILDKYIRICIISNKKVGNRMVKEKFGRMLAFVFFIDEKYQAHDLASHLIEIGYAVPYFGGKKI